MRTVLELLAVVLLVIALFILWAIIDWFAGVTAPIFGPIILTALVIGLFWAMFKMAQWGSR